MAEGRQACMAQLRHIFTQRYFKLLTHSLFKGLLNNAVLSTKWFNFNVHEWRDLQLHNYLLNKN